MLLAIDIGNSNISVGLFDRQKDLRFLASLDTDSRKTADQISIDLLSLFTLYGCDIKEVSGAIFSSVVPQLNFMMEKALTRLLGKPPVVVGPGVKTGLNIRLAVQSQVGADIVADAVSALEQFTAPIITIDMGTATTVTAVDADGAFRGGAIIPGVQLSLSALASNTSLLPSISLDAPPKAIGTNTVDCMKSGSILGTALLLDGMIDRMEAELGQKAAVVATGGLARCIVPICQHEILLNEDLLLYGLAVLYEKNK